MNSSYLLKITAILFFSVLNTTNLYSQTYITGKTPYVTQMHIHGWSNHNGAQKPGSLQYHNWQTDSVGIDVLWWAEHHGQFEQDTLILTFDGATVNPVTLDVENIPFVNSGEPNRWECLAKQGLPSASFTGDTLNLALTATGTQLPDTFSYAPRSLAGLIKDIAFVKPLASKPILQFQMNPDITDAVNTQIRFVFRLAWHYRQQEGQDVIIFEFVPSPTPGSVTSNNNDSVRVQIPVIPGWQTVELDLLEASALLDHGIDNIISDFEFQLLAANTSTIATGVSNFKMIPLYYVTDSIIFSEKSVLEDYTNIYHTHNILGVEYSGTQHLNGYFPKSINNNAIFEGKIFGNVTKWTDRVHNNGGLVSFNHMFGTDWTVDSDSIQNYRSDTTATYILNTNAYKADILEVGYYKRGGSDFARHLKTWDKVTANGLFLYGNGVSDSHGDIWMDDDNLFHTYIWSTDSSDIELLSSLSFGKMYFGNYKYFQGEFYYTLGNLEMGDRGFITQTNIAPQIHLTPFPQGCKIKLTQILIDSTLQLTYLHNETLIDTAAMPLLDLTLPSFVRFGVYDSTDKPLVFGQPIIILGLQTGIEEIQTNQPVQMKIFPNPANEKLNLELNFMKAGNYSVRIYDMNSKFIEKIEEKYFYKGKYGYMTDISHLQSGSYLVEVRGFSDVVNKQFIVR